MVSSLFRRATFAGALVFLFSCVAPLSASADEAQEVSKLIQSNQLDLALQRVESALAQKPRDAQMRFFKGLILTEQGKSADAIAVFQRLTEDYPELPEPYNNLAVLYASQGEYEKARAALEMAIRTHPSYATAHENLGDVYAKLASQAYDKALALDSTNTAAQSKLALIHSLISVNNAPGKKATPEPAGPGPSKTNAPSSSGGATSAPVSSASPAKPAPSPLVASSAPTSGAKTPASAAGPSSTTGPAGPASNSPPPPSSPAVAPSPPAPTSTPTATPTPTPAPVVVATAKPSPAPPAAATPASSAPVASSSESGANSGEKSAVSEAVNAWAQAWASKDVPTYLAAYSSDFVTPAGQSRQQWEEDRRARILGKSSITIKLDELEVSVQGDHATAHFRQDYHADHLSANSRKTLTLVRNNGKWLIQQERSGA